jgi:hypothetical protein
MIDLGGTYQIAVDVRSTAGALVDPTGATLTITLPDGTTTTPTVTLPSAVPGQLRVTYTPVQAGRHAWRMVTTGPVTSYGDVFDVSPLLPGAIASMADTKAHLNMNPATTTDDDELRIFIASATAAVERELGRAVVRRTVVERHTFPYPARQYTLSTVPLLTLSLVERLDKAGTWSPTDFDPDPDTGTLTCLPATASLQGLVRFTYDAGLAIVPWNYQLAEMIITKHLWETQRGAQGGVVLGGEMEPAGYGYGPGFAIPNRARELLGTTLPGVA